MNTHKFDISKNTLGLGDNIDLIKLLPDESIDLIYLDPPFNSNNKYIVVDESDVKYFNDVWRGGSNTYLEFLFDRLILLKSKLKKTGSIYLHCDPTESHYIKIMLDKVFGRNMFLNEIIWCYRGGGVPKDRFAEKHDVILSYSKTNSYIFNKQFQPYSEASQKLINSRGGISIDGKVRDVERGASMTDWWSDINSLQTWSPERVKYPTQKPLALLERIIKASSNEGDIVLDPFMGSGTTLVAAAKLNRRFIGFDQSASALMVTKHRLDEVKTSYEIYKDSFDYEEIRNAPPFEFEKFIVEKLGGIPNDKQRGDMGVDGRIVGEKRGVIQVKRSDNIGRNVIDNFVAAMKREDVNSGSIVAFSFGSGAEKEAARVRQEGEFDIQLVRVDSLIKVNLPPKLSLKIEDNVIIATAEDIDGDVVNYTWWLDSIENSPYILIDKVGKMIIYDVKASKVICRATDDKGYSIINEIIL